MRYGIVADSISIHALREEGDVRAQTCCRVAIHFYPRPPRGGRRRGTASLPGHGKISIHALREEGDELRHGCRRGCPISIHALREEGDAAATAAAFAAMISIHALREEGDQGSAAQGCPQG